MSSNWKSNNKDIDKEFEEIYSNMLKKLDLKYLEELKKKAILEENKNVKERKIIFFLVIGIFLGMLLLGFLSETFIIIAYRFAIAIIILSAIFSIITSHIKKKNNKKTDVETYLEQYKSVVIPTFLGQFKEKINYMPNKSVSESIYKNAEFERYDKYSSEDVMEISLQDNSNITMCDLKTQYETYNNDGDVSHHPLFNGIFTVIETTKPFNEILFLKKDKKYKTKNIIPKIEKIQLDSNEFEDYFDIYSTNPVITMQLLTSDIMQFFVDFQKSTGIDFELTIKNNKIYIRFFSGNIFELGYIIESLINKDKFKKYYEILTFTLELTYKITNLLKNTEY